MTDIIRIPPKTRARVEARYNAVHGRFDVVESRLGYLAASAFPAAWAYWKLEEASDGRLDSSGNNRTIIPGSDYGYGVPEQGVGVLGNCVKLSRTGTYGSALFLVPEETISDPAGYFTYAFWLNMHPGTTGAGGPFAFRSNRLSIDVSWNVAKTKFKISSQLNYVVATDYIFDPDVWYFVTVYGDGNGLYIAMNDSVVASDTTQGPVSGENSDTTIYTWGGYYSTGAYALLDNAGIWVGANTLTSAHRTQLYSAGAGWSPY